MAKATHGSNELFPKAMGFARRFALRRHESGRQRLP
jgi:hypothetical protein